MQRKINNLKYAKQIARRRRVARRIRRSRRPRLTVFRSSRHIYAQLIDCEGRTLGSISTRSKAIAVGLSATGNVEAATKVGQAIAELAREKKISEVVFNRNGFLYHGRVKALADAAREGGLHF